MVSDRGAAYVSKAFADFVNEHGIEHILATTGVPRGNGQIERINRTILSVSAKLSSADSTRWYRYVTNVQRAINSSIYRSTKVTPFELMFGTKVRDGINDQVVNAIEAEWQRNFDDERHELRNPAKINIAKAQKNYKANYDKKRKDDSTYSAWILGTW